MTIQIKLKRKYTRGGKTRHKGGENWARPKKRNKIGWKRHTDLYGEPAPVTMVVNGKTGHHVFVKG